MLTYTPDWSASSYECNFCGIASQVLSPLLDENGCQLFTDEGMPRVVNDDAAASAEITDHILATHSDVV